MNQKSRKRLSCAEKIKEDQLTDFICEEKLWKLNDDKRFEIV